MLIADLGTSMALSGTKAPDFAHHFIVFLWSLNKQRGAGDSLPLSVYRD
jgi:hypothetical protein